MPLQIVRNNITNMAADAIVNTANPEPRVGGGTDSAIYEAAGYDRLLKARKKIGRIERGNAAVTRAYNLSAKYIIHTVGPVWQGGTCGEREILRECYRNSLDLAKKKRCRSVAFPLISAGVYGFPKSEALEIATSEIRRFLEHSEMTVYLVVFGREEYELSGKIFEDVTSYIDEHYVAEQSREEYARDGQTQVLGGMFSRENAELRMRNARNSRRDDALESKARDFRREDAIENKTRDFKREDALENKGRDFRREEALEDKVRNFRREDTLERKARSSEREGVREHKKYGSDKEYFRASEERILESDDLRSWEHNARFDPYTGKPLYEEAEDLEPNEAASDIQPPDLASAARSEKADRSKANTATTDIQPPDLASAARSEKADRSKANTATTDIQPPDLASAARSEKADRSKANEAAVPPPRDSAYAGRFEEESSFRKRRKEDEHSDHMPYSPMASYSVRPLPTPPSPGLPQAAAPSGRKGRHRSLDEAVASLGENFPEMLFRLIDERGLTDVEVYKRANIDRKLFSKIRSKKGYQPSKKTAIALAIALHLNLDQTKDLLSRAGYALSPGNIFDVIVEYFITNEEYDIDRINIVLFDHHEQLLGA